MIKKEILDSVLSPFLIIRPCPYLKLKEYEHLAEEPCEIYISSSWFKSHWIWDHMRKTMADKYKNDTSILIGCDYAVCLKHKIRTRQQLIKEKRKLDTTSFALEYQNMMIGSSNNTYYKYELLENAQILGKSFYTNDNDLFLDKERSRKIKPNMPKQDGEIRIVSIDIAMVSNDKGDNDNTVISCIRAFQQGENYERHCVSIEAFNGGNTTEQAIKIKQTFYDFEADWVVLDIQSSGLNVCDELGKILYDKERDMEYESWKCFNDEEAGNRIKNPHAKPIIFGIKASAKLNDEIHRNMKNLLEKELLKLLKNSTKAKDDLESQKDYVNGNIDKKLELEMPFLETDLLINEMINLTYELVSGTYIKLIENRSGTKDRYISLAYGNYFLTYLERDLTEDNRDNSWNEAPVFASEINFN